MSGIVGAIWIEPERAIGRNSLSQMLDAVGHRGRNGRVVHIDEFRLQPPYEPIPGIALGACANGDRLAIDGQLGWNETGAIAAIVDGTVFNRAQIRRRLEGAGHDIRTPSDAELIAHLYEDEGVDCFARWNGPFAAAVWDSARRRLVLARDPFGRQPLVYHAAYGRFLFASEWKSLFAMPDVGRELDAAAIDAYLAYGHVPHPCTMFREIRSLPPGHQLVYQDGQLSVAAFWDLPSQRESISSVAQCAEELQSRLSEALTARCAGDESIGVMCDDTPLALLSATLISRSAPRAVKLLSLSATDRKDSGTSATNPPGGELGAQCIQLPPLKPSDEVIVQFVAGTHQPTATAAALVDWHLAQQVGDEVDVMLDSIGANMLFARGVEYQAMAFASRLAGLPPLVRRTITARAWQSLLARWRHQLGWRRVQRWVDATAQDPIRGRMEWLAICDEQQRAELYQDAFVERLTSDPVEFLRNGWSRAGWRDTVSKAAWSDLLLSVPDSRLSVIDRASTGNSLSWRHPWLDLAVGEYAATLPTMAGKWGRREHPVLRRVLRQAKVVSRAQSRRVTGSLPLSDWLRGPLKGVLNRTLGMGGSHTGAYLRPEVVQNWIKQHQNGVADHTRRLWALLILELWLRDHTLGTTTNAP